MHRLQEIVRLHRLGRSGREIARLLRMGRETVRVYMIAFGEAGLLDGDARELPDVAQLREVVGAIRRGVVQESHPGDSNP